MVLALLSMQCLDVLLRAAERPRLSSRHASSAISTASSKDVSFQECVFSPIRATRQIDTFEPCRLLCFRRLPRPRLFPEPRPHQFLSCKLQLQTACLLRSSIRRGFLVAINQILELGKNVAQGMDCVGLTLGSMHANLVTRSKIFGA